MILYIIGMLFIISGAILSFETNYLTVGIFLFVIGVIVLSLTQENKV